MSVQVIGRLSATVLYLCFFYGFEAAVSAPCGRVANASFLACPSSACIVAFGLFGSVASSFGTMWKGCERTVFGLPFFWLVFCMPWARSLLPFEAFGSFA